MGKLCYLYVVLAAAQIVLARSWSFWESTGADRQDEVEEGLVQAEAVVDHVAGESEVERLLREKEDLKQKIEAATLFRKEQAAIKNKKKEIVTGDFSWDRYGPGWDEAFLAPELLMSDYDYELLMDTPMPGVYTFPLLSPVWCREMLAAATGANWTVNRHKNYPTNDFLLEDFSSRVHGLYRETLRNLVHKAVEKAFMYTGDLQSEETFVVRYKQEAQAKLALHHDSSDYTVTLALTEPGVDHQGGGTFFVQHKQIVHLKQGHIMFHPGKFTHKHGARPVTGGERYVMVSFVMT